MLEFNKVDHEADPYSIANTIALNALVARAKSKGELLAHLKKRFTHDVLLLTCPGCDTR